MQRMWLSNVPLDPHISGYQENQRLAEGFWNAMYTEHRRAVWVRSRKPYTVNFYITHSRGIQEPHPSYVRHTKCEYTKRCMHWKVKKNGWPIPDAVTIFDSLGLQSWHHWDYNHDSWPSSTAFRPSSDLLRTASTVISLCRSAPQIYSSAHGGALRGAATFSASKRRSNRPMAAGIWPLWRFDEKMTWWFFWCEKMVNNFDGSVYWIYDKMND